MKALLDRNLSMSQLHGALTTEMPSISLSRFREMQLALSQVTYRRSTNSAGLVHALGWDPLEQRRLMAQALLFYKLHNGLVNINMPPEFTLLNRVTRHHNLHYRQLQTNVLSY